MPESLNAPTPGQVTWSISRVGGSSDKYGVCEVCKEHAQDVFRQSATVAFVDENGEVQQTFHGAPGKLWGHEACLMAARVKAT